jgi:hypothetical protein
MLAILTDKENWEGQTLLGQLNGRVVLEVETAPTEYDYEDITDSETTFMQRVFDGIYGERITYQKLCEIKNLIDEVGNADSYEGLLCKKIDLQQQMILDTQLALCDVYEMMV